MCNGNERANPWELKWERLWHTVIQISHNIHVHTTCVFLWHAVHTIYNNWQIEGMFINNKSWNCNWWNLNTRHCQRDLLELQPTRYSHDIQPIRSLQILSACTQTHSWYAELKVCWTTPVNIGSTKIGPIIVFDVIIRCEEQTDQW